MKILQTILILFISISTYAQSNYDGSKISHKTNKAVKKIVKVNELMSSAVYYSGTRPKQWDNFEELRNSASKEELIELTVIEQALKKSDSKKYEILTFENTTHSMTYLDKEFPYFQLLSGDYLMVINDWIEKIETR